MFVFVFYFKALLIIFSILNSYPFGFVFMIVVMLDIIKHKNENMKHIAMIFSFLFIGLSFLLD